MGEGDIAQIRVCVLVFQGEHEVLLRRAPPKKLAGGSAVLDFTVTGIPLHDCIDVREFAQGLLETQGLCTMPAPTLATVFEEEVGSGRFDFVFFADGKMTNEAHAGEMQAPVRKLRSRDVPCDPPVAAKETNKIGSVSPRNGETAWGGAVAPFAAASLDAIRRGVTEAGEEVDFSLSDCLSRVVGTFRPLLPELRRVAKHSVRAYPLATGAVAKYRRGDLEDFMLLDPVQYTFDTKGKGVRSQSIAVLARHFQIAAKDLDSMLFCIERFHEASLVIDDIEDASELRRDERCAYLEFGTPLTLNAAYLCVFKMLNDVPLLFRQHHDRSRQLLLQGFVSAHRGQGLDIYWREHSYCPTEEEYIDMIRGKTSTPFVMAASLFFLHSEDRRLRIARAAESVVSLVVSLFALVGMAWVVLALLRLFLGSGFFKVAPSSPQKLKSTDGEVTRETWVLQPASVTKQLPSNTERCVAHLFDQIGVFFQIRDDYINLTSEKYWEKKGFCDDIHEKKYSFPIIRMIRSKAGRYRDLVALFEQEEELSMEQLRAGLSWIEDTDALAYTRSFLVRLRDDIVQTINNAGLPELDTLIMQRLTIE